MHAESFGQTKIDYADKYKCKGGIKAESNSTLVQFCNIVKHSTSFRNRSKKMTAKH